MRCAVKNWRGWLEVEMTKIQPLTATNVDSKSKLTFKHIYNDIHTAHILFIVRPLNRKVGNRKLGRFVVGLWK